MSEQSKRTTQHGAPPLLEVTDAIAAYDWDLERAKTLHKALNLAMKREVEHMLAADPGTTREAA